MEINNLKFAEILKFCTGRVIQAHSQKQLSCFGPIQGCWCLAMKKMFSQKKLLLLGLIVVLGLFALWLYARSVPVYPAAGGAWDERTQKFYHPMELQKMNEERMKEEAK